MKCTCTYGLLVNRFKFPKQAVKHAKKCMKLDAADKYFSLYIRTRDNFTCQRCGKKSDSVACSHFYGRRNEATRFEPDNCVSLCYGCHKYFDETNREAYRDFKLKQLGKKRFESLKVQVNTYKRKDRKLEALIWKKALKSLNKYEDKGCIKS